MSKPGRVARIRLNPKDCMSVVDVINAAGINTRGMSFASAVSLSLSSLMETARQSNLIPTRDGFDYLDMMQQFEGRSGQARKLQITQAVESLGSSIIAPVVEPPLQRLEGGTLQRPSEDALKDQGWSDEEIKEAGTRLGELIAKQELSERDSNVVWSDKDQEEYWQLYGIVYPEG